MIFIQAAESIGLQEMEEVDLSLLEEAAQETLDYEGASKNVDLTIVLTGDAQIQDLNRQFRGIDAPTDVLSFPSDGIDPDVDTPYLGDVIISVQRAARQAEAEKHSLEDEMCLLVVHGVLHLLSYDHQGREEKQRMWAAQAEILTGLGRSITGPVQYKGG